MRIIVIFYFTTGNIYFKLRKWRKKKRKKKNQTLPKLYHRPFFFSQKVGLLAGEAAAAAAVFLRVPFWFSTGMYWPRGGWGRGGCCPPRPPLPRRVCA